MAFDEDGQINVEQLLVLDAYPTIDHAQVDLGWMAEDQGRQGIVNCATCQVKRIEAIADEIGCLARRERANIIASQGGCAASCCQPESFPGGQSRGVSGDTL